MQTREKINPRDGSLKSMWQQHEVVSVFAPPSLSPDTYDVLIVGAGITGITTALLLQQEGKRCVVVEANTVGFGTTGGTSAHLNTFFDATYPDVESDFGSEGAKLLARAGKESFELIKSLVNALSIECDLQEKPAILYAETEKQAKQLEDILVSNNNVGVETTESADNKIPVDFIKALRIEGQGQFHPIKYLNGLVKEFLRLGGIIYENAMLSQSTFEDGIHIAKIPGKPAIQAKHLVYATHIPPGINLFNFKCAPYRSYVIAVLLRDEVYPQELIYDMQEPYHYFRTHTIDGKTMLLIGGEDHKTGHGNAEESFERLIAYANEYFDVAEVVYQWSSQYYVPTDGLPYIGLSPSGADTYVATGFNGNGMMFGTISGRMIADQIMGYESPYEKLFNPSRIKPVAGFTEFVRENADVAYHFVKDRFAIDEVDSLNVIPSDSGEIIEYKGEKLAVYKDRDGKVYVLSPVCTHAGCFVKWNNAEKSWDCPCHGGRYDKYGNVLTGPPQMALNTIFPEDS